MLKRMAKLRASEPQILAAFPGMSVGRMGLIGRGSGVWDLSGFDRRNAAGAMQEQAGHEPVIQAPTGQVLMRRDIGFYVINLERSADRLAEVAQVFGALCLPFERITAVDGRTMGKEAIRAVYDGRFSLDGGCYLHDTWVAITLSHIRALETFLSSESAFAVILEDDAVFTAEALFIINHLVAAKDDGTLEFDGVELMGPTNNSRDVIAQARNVGGYTIGRPAKTTPISGCMLYTREGAEKLLRHALPIRTHWDNYLSLSWRHGARYLTVRPFPVHVREGSASTYHGLEAGPVRLTLLLRIRRAFYRIYQGPRRLMFSLSWLGLAAGLRIPGSYQRIKRGSTLPKA